MDVATMLQRLGYRLEDPDELEHTQALKLAALNQAQRFIVNHIDPIYLTELEASQTGIAAANGRAALTSTTLGAEPLGGERAIRRVKLQNAWREPFPVEDLPALNNYYFTPTVNDCRWYVSHGYIHCLPSSIEYIDVVVFLKLPDEMDASGDNEATINPALHDCLLNFAEGQRWAAENDLSRATRAEQRGMAEIDDWNTKASAIRQMQGR